jgi:hypothetical protein
MASEDLLKLLRKQMPIKYGEYRAGQKRVGLVIVDEVNGFATVGAGNSVSLEFVLSTSTPPL